MGAILGALRFDAPGMDRRVRPQCPHGRDAHPGYGGGIVSAVADFQVRTTWTNDNPATIWNQLAQRLGREPTNAEARDEVRRILRGEP
jgi:hypothetical protein